MNEWLFGKGVVIESFDKKRTFYRVVSFHLMKIIIILWGTIEDVEMLLSLGQSVVAQLRV